MNLLLRVVSGAILLAVLAAVLLLGTPWLAALIGAGTVVGAWEFAGLAGRIGLPPARWLLLPLALWLAVRYALPPSWQPAEWPLVAAVVVGLLVMVAGVRPLSGWVAALGGALYLGFTLGFYVALYRWHQPDPNHFGLRLAALPVLAVVAGDTAAYLLGSALGRHPFFRSVSPRKTVEGAVAGAAATIVLVALAGPPLVGIGAPAGAGLGALIAIAAQGGDLVESALKRQAGVKDSSGLIPGHGGLLDRVDSLVLVGPVVYCYLKLLAL